MHRGSVLLTRFLFVRSSDQPEASFATGGRPREELRTYGQFVLSDIAKSSALLGSRRPACSAFRCPSNRPEDEASSSTIC